jgi:hypothetical protein
MRDPLRGGPDLLAFSVRVASSWTTPAPRWAERVRVSADHPRRRSAGPKSPNLKVDSRLLWGSRLSCSGSLAYRVSGVRPGHQARRCSEPGICDSAPTRRCAISTFGSTPGLRRYRRQVHERRCCRFAPRVIARQRLSGLLWPCVGPQESGQTGHHSRSWSCGGRLAAYAPFVGATTPRSTPAGREGPSMRGMGNSPRG